MFKNGSQNDALQWLPDLDQPLGKSLNTVGKHRVRVVSFKHKQRLNMLRFTFVTGSVLIFNYFTGCPMKDEKARRLEGRL